jgi:uncharacterized membrane protein
MNAIKKMLVAAPFLMKPLPWISVAFATTTTLVSPITDAAGIQGLMCSIVAWFIWIVILVSVIMVVFAAFTYATAEDDTEKTSKARRTLLYAAVGIVVALLAAGFPAIVETVFPNQVTFPLISCL